MSKIYAVGLGVGTQNKSGEWLEVFYPEPLFELDGSLAEALSARFDSGSHTLGDSEIAEYVQIVKAAGLEAHGNIVSTIEGSARKAVICILTENAAPSSVPEAYLKLHLISHRLVRPHGTDLSGIFGSLPNVAWTSEGAIDLSELTERQLSARSAGRALSVDSIDKFPKMTDYVVPSGVRIADTARVRLGAYLGEGTTIMHEGFVNFNAGTEGPSMIEGRISAGVFVGAGSDFGGGCSAMGTLSGGGNIVISVGKECLIGANAGIGIPLGDRCTVEAGLYITAGTKVQMVDENRKTIGSAKASDLSGKSDLLFRRNSLSGAVECLTNKSAVELNEELHAHN